MERWVGRVAVVTGASSGIGAAVAKELVRQGMKVVGVARRRERIEELRNELDDASGELYALGGDLSKEDDVATVFSWVKENLGGVDVLVNSAGITGKSTLQEGPISAWEAVIGINLMGLAMCTREALLSMNERNVDDGHIIHINSINGHGVPLHSHEYGLYMYCASKNGVTALTEGLRRELMHKKSQIRVTAISPGMCKTEIMLASGFEIPPGKTLDDMYSTIPHLFPQDLADSVVYVLGTPPHVQIHEIIIKPVAETTY